MKTMNKTERQEMLNKMLNGIENEIKDCTRNIESPMIVRCNCIVATEDAYYQVGVKKGTNSVEVLIGNYTNPVWMTERAADNLLNEQRFEASNGYGPLTFKVWGWKSFFRKRLENLMEAKAAIEETMKIVLV